MSCGLKVNEFENPASQGHGCKTCTLQCPQRNVLHRWTHPTSRQMSRSRRYVCFSLFTQSHFLKKIFIRNFSVTCNIFHPPSLWIQCTVCTQKYETEEAFLQCTFVEPCPASQLLEGATKYYCVAVLMSDAFYDLLPPDVQRRRVTLQAAAPVPRVPALSCRRILVLVRPSHMRKDVSDLPLRL